MIEVLHIARKDVTRLRWLVLLWMLVLASRVTLAAAGSVVESDMSGAEFVIHQIAGVGVSLQLLMAGLLIVRLVHEEPLVGLNAFWLTRPYGIRALLAAKALFVLVVLVALPLAADVVTMSLFDAGPPALLRAGASFAADHVTWALSLMVLAALTPTLGVFAMGVIGVVAAASLSAAVVLALRPFVVDDVTRYQPSAGPDATRAIVTQAVYLLAALSVIVYQYHYRRWRVATAIAVAGFAASLAVPAVWPWPFAGVATAAADDLTSSVAVVHDAASGFQVNEEMSVSRGQRPRMRQVASHITLSGLPADTSVRIVEVRAGLVLDDGTRFDSSQLGSSRPQSEFDRVDGGQSPLQAALGGVALLMRPEIPSWERRTVLLRLREEDYSRYRGRSGRLELALTFHLGRTRELGALPLTPGAALDDGVSRVELTQLLRRADGYSATIREWRARSPLEARAASNRYFLLRNRSRRMAMAAGVETGWPNRAISGVNAMVLPALVTGRGLAVSQSRTGFELSTQVLRFPQHDTAPGELAQIDPAWYDGAELVVLETGYAGRIEKSLSVDRFVIP